MTNFFRIPEMFHKLYDNFPCKILLSVPAHYLGTITLNQGVQGSSPWRCTKALFLKRRLWGWCFYFVQGDFVIQIRDSGHPG